MLIILKTQIYRYMYRLLLFPHISLSPSIPSTQANNLSLIKHFARAFGSSETGPSFQNYLLMKFLELLPLWMKRELFVMNTWKNSWKIILIWSNISYMNINLYIIFWANLVSKISDRWRIVTEFSPYKRVKFAKLCNIIKKFFYFLSSLNLKIMIKYIFITI